MTLWRPRVRIGKAFKPGRDSVEWGLNLLPLPLFASAGFGDGFCGGSYKKAAGGIHIPMRFRSQRANPMTTGKLRKILLVEDAPDIQLVLRIALERLGGFEVRPCASGREAIAAAPAFAPDLILLDVMMPEMDGPATLEELKKLPEMGEVPVVFMTAKAGQEELARYRAMGAVDVLFKPFDPNTLAPTLLSIWESANSFPAAGGRRQ